MGQSVLFRTKPPLEILDYEGQGDRILRLKKEGYALPVSSWDALDNLRTPGLAEVLISGLMTLFRDVDTYKKKSSSAPIAIVFAARRMAHLFMVMRHAGLGRELTEMLDGVEVTSDRFFLLQPQDCLDAFMARKIFVCDDTYVTGGMLEHRTRRIEDYRASLVGRGAGSPEIDARSLFFATNSCGTDKEIAVVDGKRRFCAAPLQNQIALTLASQGFGLFTDFPVTEEFECSKYDLINLLEKIDSKYVDTSPRAFDDKPVFSYSMSLLNWVRHSQDDQLRATFDSVVPISQVVKLRALVRESGDGLVKVRLVLKVILRDTSVEFLERFSKRLGLYIPSNQSGVDTIGCDEPLSGARGEVFKQLFALLEYYVAKRVLSLLLPSLSSVIETSEIKFDDDVSRYILGTSLHERLSQAGTDAADFDWLGREQVPLREDHASDERCGNSSTDTGPLSIALLGDAHAQAIDGLICSDEHDRHAIPFTFSDLYLAVLDLLKNRRLVLPEPWTHYALSIILDGLNDSGRLVPGQKCSAWDDKTYIGRGYRKGEASASFSDLTPGQSGGRLMRFADTIYRTPETKDNGDYWVFSLEEACISVSNEG